MRALGRSGCEIASELCMARETLSRGTEEALDKCTAGLGAGGACVHGQDGSRFSEVAEKSEGQSRFSSSCVKDFACEGSQGQMSRSTCQVNSRRQKWEPIRCLEFSRRPMRHPLTSRLTCG